jgi:hypothetical protein
MEKQSPDKRKTLLYCLTLLLANQYFTFFIRGDLNNYDFFIRERLLY